MAYVNLQAHEATVGGVKKLLAKVVSLDFLKLWHAYCHLHHIKNKYSCVATRYCKIIRNKMQLFQSTLCLDYAI